MKNLIFILSLSICILNAQGQGCTDIKNPNDLLMTSLSEELQNQSGNGIIKILLNANLKRLT